MSHRSAPRSGFLRPASATLAFALPFALSLPLGLAVLTSSGASLAQPSPDTRAAAAALFEDGRRLMSEGKYPEACPKLEESQRMDPGMGSLFQLSVCWEQLGRTASAWVGFRDVANMALTAGQADREKLARGRATALEPKLMRLKITGPSSAGVEVKRDGAVVSPALWGTPVPLDPGPHKVSAAATGKEPWEVTVQLAQPGGTVSVEVPPLLDRSPGAAVPLAPPSQAGPAVAPGPGAPPPAPVEGASPRPWQRPLGITATVLGAAGLGVGIGVGLMAKSSFSQSNDAGGGCNATTNKCNTAGEALRCDAVNKGNIATGVFVAGAVLAAGGIVLWVTAPSSHAAKAGSTGALPQIGLGPTGGALRGRW